MKTILLKKNKKIEESEDSSDEDAYQGDSDTDEAPTKLKNKVEIKDEELNETKRILKEKKAKLVE